MSTTVDYEHVGYHLGQAIGQLAMLAAFIWPIVWAVRTSRRRSQAMPGVVGPVRTPDNDLGQLAWSLTLHVAHDQACALVARAMGDNPLVEFVDPAVPTWRVNGGSPVIALTPTPAGSLLAARKVVVPLPSPQGATVWELVLKQVQREADSSGVRTSRTKQRHVEKRTLDDRTSIRGPAD
jgi:hypothetical protein